MPRSWYDFFANKLPEKHTAEDVKRRALNLRILADKKPYFMRYIYPKLMKDYNTYIKNTNVKCLREFRIDLSELLGMSEDELTDRQKEFLNFYSSRMPVGTNNCIMNKICRRFEREFDGYIKYHSSKDDFDFSMLKSDAEYTPTQYYAVAKLYEQHKAQMRAYQQMLERERADSDGHSAENLKREFTERCLRVCSNADTLCNIVVDICYCRIGSQQFAWDVCGREMFINLLKHSEGKISFPVRSEDGEISFKGYTFAMKEVKSRYGRDCSE